jgi:hypothetical protein
MPVAAALHLQNDFYDPTIFDRLGCFPLLFCSRHITIHSFLFDFRLSIPKIPLASCIQTFLVHGFLNRFCQLRSRVMALGVVFSSTQFHIGLEW